MVRGTVLKGFLAAAMLCVVALGTSNVPAAADTGFPKQVRVVAGERVTNRGLSVGLGRSVVIELGEDVRDVLVSDPTVADAVMRTNRRIFVLGVKAGQANLFLFGAGGRQLASFDISVSQDTSDLNRLLQRLVPNGDIAAENVNGTILLSGTVPSPLDASRAVEIANGFAGGAEAKVINMLTVLGKEQVYLKVTISEVERSLIKQLGIDFQNISVGAGPYTATYTGNLVDNAVAGLGFSKGATQINAVLSALQEDGVVRTLAEPTVTAISGENASFLVGGEFPIPTSQSDGVVSVEFKPFGVGLDFTPIVLSGGRISLRIKTEVSELTTDGAVDIGSLTISALKVRRAESTVELPSGGSLVMAGLMRDNYSQNLSGLPGLMQLPILGNLFKSREFRRNQTELVVFVTRIWSSPWRRTS
ncbi:type II and III secretion system protein family protein [Breoghania sp. L-A4]|uniref:type II and III secretion system protein family protein n=1 Tax=Breoghania sp. L-A4 TaxID=2304600 RepID=UPI0019685F8F|nr:type II and III secretion system protein family protein [Breoghania sp. L-A4]